MLDFPTSSTSDTGKDILSFATEAAIPYCGGGENGDGAVVSQVANQIRNERNWRWNYHKHVIRNMEICTQSNDICLAIAEAGLKRIYDTFVYNNNKRTLSLKDALEQRPQASSTHQPEVFEAGTVFGNGQLPNGVGSSSSMPSSEHTDSSATSFEHLILPMKDNRTLRGTEVIAQLWDWVSRGVIEPDTALAVQNLHPNTDLNLQQNSSEWVFVIMGAGAAMGPLQTLLKLGATVIAIDLPIPSVWERLIRFAKTTPGTLSFPMTKKATMTNNVAGVRRSEAASGSSWSLSSDNLSASEIDMTKYAGCNLLTQIIELRDWLIQQYPTKRLVIGSYAYLDSSEFVKVSLAMDAVASQVLKARPNTALAYLCSPTDCFAIPQGARKASIQNYKKDNDGNGNDKDFLKKLFRFMDKGSKHQRPGGGRFLQPNIAERKDYAKLPLVDALVLQQGPNYYLAKRLQHWRAMVSKFKFGAVVSSNVAPASNTRSVLKNKLLAIAFAGAHYIPPIEIFDPETSNVLMTYLLLHDLKEQTIATTTSGRSKNKENIHPLNLFATTPVHNGIWRCGYQIRSLLELVVLYSFLQKYQPQLLLAMAVGVGAGAAVLRSNL